MVKKSKKKGGSYLGREQVAVFDANGKRLNEPLSRTSYKKTAYGKTPPIETQAREKYNREFYKLQVKLSAEKQLKERQKLDMIERKKDYYSKMVEDSSDELKVLVTLIESDADGEMDDLIKELVVFDKCMSYFDKHLQFENEDMENKFNKSFNEILTYKDQASVYNGLCAFTGKWKNSDKEGCKIFFDGNNSKLNTYIQQKSKLYEANKDNYDKKKSINKSFNEYERKVLEMFKGFEDLDQRGKAYSKVINERWCKLNDLLKDFEITDEPKYNKIMVIIDDLGILLYRLEPGNQQTFDSVKDYLNDRNKVDLYKEYKGYKEGNKEKITLRQCDTNKSKSQTETSQTEPPQTEKHQSETPQPEKPQPETPQPEKPQPEKPQPEKPQPETPQTKTTQPKPQPFELSEELTKSLEHYKHISEIFHSMESCLKTM